LKTKIALFTAIFTSLAVFSQKQWTLKECVDYALKNNITIKQNRLNIEIAEADVKSNKANFLPSINASTSGNLSTGSSFDPVSQNRTANTTLFGGALGVNASYTVFNGFKNLNQKKQAVLGVEGSKLDLVKVENDISLNVVNEYLNVLFAKENLAVAKVQAEISKKQIKRAKAQFEGGAIPKGDLLNVQSTAANDLQNVVLQENTLSIALLRLCQLLQIPSKDFDITIIKVSSPSAALLYDNSDIVYEKALTLWPEIERAKLDVENTKLGIEIAKSGYYPTVNASLGANTNYGYFLDPSVPTGRFLEQLDGNLGFSLGFSVNIPIFNGFRNDANVERSIVSNSISQFRLESQKLQLQQEIESAFLDAKAAAKTYEAAQVSLEAQKEAFKNAQVSYDYGSMTQFDFDQVRNRLVNAEGAMIRAKYDYVFKTKVLKFYYGESIVD